MQQQILHLGSSLPAQELLCLPLHPSFLQGPHCHHRSQLHCPPRAHLVPLPPDLTPQAHGHGTALANIKWTTETEEQNWNSIRRTCSRKILSNKHGKLEKEHLSLRTKAAIEHRRGNSNHPGAAVSFGPWTALAIGAGKANTQKTLLP